MKERRVVITGLGPLSAIGFGKDSFWSSIVDKKINLSQEKIYVDSTLWDTFWTHKINNFNIDDFGIDKYALDNIRTWKKNKEDRDLLYLLAAVKLALDDSGIEYDNENNNVGLFLTVEHPGFEDFSYELIKKALLYMKECSAECKNIPKTKLFKALYNEFVGVGYDTQTFMYLYLVAKAFNMHGYSLFTSNACASGLFSLESAVRQIRYGGSDIAVVAGGDYPNTMFKHMWFKDQKLYAEDGKIKPFSKNADGIVFGEGASAIVLEELDHALRRGVNIYAEYLGGGFSLEGWKVTVPKIGSGSYAKAIQEALENSRLDAKDVDLINPHGVGINVTDGYEAQAITEVFTGKSINPLISAFKPYVGHNLGGSAIMETIILLLALKNNIILGTLNLEKEDPKYSIKLLKENVEKPLDTVMKLSCGFAGYNGAVAFRKYA